MSTFKKTIRVFPAWDKRHPEPSKNYGIGCCHISFVLKGDNGAIHFDVFSGWYLPQQVSEHGQKQWKDWQPSGAQISYHSYIPRYEGQSSSGECDWLDGKKCYSDTSFCYADEVFAALVSGGDEAMWKELEEFYNDNLK